MSRLWWAGVLCALCFAGCSATSQPSEPAQSQTQMKPWSAPEPYSQDTDSSPESSQQSEPDSQSAENSSGIDVDLVGLSGTMMYAQMYEIMMVPEDYVGKTLRLAGQFTVYDDLDPNRLVFTVMVADALACCQQGMEFVWTGEHSYPEDYPEPGQTVVVTGRYERYDNQGMDSYRIVSDSVSW